MDRKRRFPTYTEALVQFEVDQMTAIVSIKTIIDAADSVIEGNVVNILYNGEQERVKIIRLSGTFLLARKFHLWIWRHQIGRLYL